MPNIQDLFNQILVETINKPGDESMSEDEKILLLEDLRRLGLNMPPPSYTPPANLKSDEQPLDEDLFEDADKVIKKVDDAKDEVKQSDNDEEEKIPSSSQKSTKKKSVPPMDVIKQRAISTYSDVRPIKDDEGSLGEELSEEDEEDEPDNPAGSSNTKWNLFGSLKKLFFKGPPPSLNKKSESESIQLESNLPDQPLDTNIGQAIKEEPEKQEKLEKQVKKEKVVEPENKNDEKEEKIITEPEEKYINDPIELKNLSEDEDVTYEFYYNRIKVSSIKTVYELINYQPTHRSIADPQIIYFKIKDRLLESDENNDNIDEKASYESNEDYSTRLKHKELVKTINQNTKDMPPCLGYFMSKYLSPYVLPLTKTNQNNSYNNPYSYNQNTYQQTIKIGESLEGQRLSWKKILSVFEGITYILSNWDEFRIQCLMQGVDLRQDLSMYSSNGLQIRPEFLFKNLLEEHIHKMLLGLWQNFYIETNPGQESKKDKYNELAEIFMGNTNLLNFETRVFFFKTAAFALSGDFNRTIHFMIQQLRKKYPKIPDQNVSKQSKQNVKINRKTLLDSSIQLLVSPNTIKRKNFLEIEYTNEIGIGLGPTFEFYYLCSKEFKDMTELWRDTEDNSLFPVPFEISAAKYGAENVVKYFEAMGWLVAKALADDRLTDLTLSPVFWDMCIGVPPSYKHIHQIDTTYGSSINELREYAAKRYKIKNNSSIDQQIKDRQLESWCLKNGSKAQDLYLFFVIPGTNVELKPNGKDIQLDDDNLDEYLDLLLEAMLITSIQKQLTAFKKGFSKIAKIEYLKIFNSNEIELIICGNNDDEKEWTVKNLKENLMPAHGYYENSSTYLNIINYMVNLDKEKRRKFLTFATGSPRLPLGGFKSLKPKMLITRKGEASQNPDLFLPTVMTCQKHLKIPDYSSYEVLKEKFDFALHEGQENFTLS